MDNDFYSIIGCKVKSSKEEILQKYKEKIKKYEELLEYDQKTKNDIKLLKTAKYVLTDDDLREKYDSIQSYKDFEAFSLELAVQAMEKMTETIDELEKEIQKELPNTKFIDIEPN